MTRLASYAVTAVLLLALPACGASAEVAVRPRTLEGETLAQRANAQLQQQNARLVAGDLTCPDVRLAVGATADCTRTVVLSGGRQVRIGATVTIDRVTGGGHFRVVVDDEAQEFGLTGESIAGDLARQYAAKFGTRPDVSCPYLRGEEGAQVTCRLVAGEDELDVDVVVTRVDRATYDTDYRFRAAG